MREFCWNSSTRILRNHLFKASQMEMTSLRIINLHTLNPLTASQIKMTERLAEIRQLALFESFQSFTNQDDSKFY
jgi:hypothetical protein